MPHESSIRETRVLLSGVGMGESPRWHDGRLWFSHWGIDEIVAVDLEGNSEVMGPGGGGSGWATNWLPDGWSEITVDGRGNIYVDAINFDFAEFNDILTSGKATGKIALVSPEGDAREVAEDLAFPNGMVVTPDNATLIVAASARVVRCSIGSSSTAPATRACWAARTAGRSSWWWRSGSVRTGSTSCCRRRRVRS